MKRLRATPPIYLTTMAIATMSGTIYIFSDFIPHAVLYWEDGHHEQPSAVRSDVGYFICSDITGCRVSRVLSPLVTNPCTGKGAVAIEIENRLSVVNYKVCG